jgi:hypothetical protein
MNWKFAKSRNGSSWNFRIVILIFASGTMICESSRSNLSLWVGAPRDTDMILDIVVVEILFQALVVGLRLPITGLGASQQQLCSSESEDRFRESVEARRLVQKA